jgi:hypothetical protein
MIRTGLLVLDVDGLTLRCRSCNWVSPTCTTVEDAAGASATHACPGREVALEPAPSGQIDTGGALGRLDGVEVLAIPSRRSRVRTSR